MLVRQEGEFRTQYIRYDASNRSPRSALRADNAQLEIGLQFSASLPTEVETRLSIFRFKY